MRSITDKARISREKLAYIADSTSAPVSVLVPITGWAAYLSGLAVGIGCIATAEDGSRASAVAEAVTASMATGEATPVAA